MKISSVVIESRRPPRDEDAAAAAAACWADSKVMDEKLGGEALYSRSDAKSHFLI